MTSKQLYWTDAHFCGLRSQTNIYGLSKITSKEGLTRLLAVSVNGHFVTVEYQKSFDNRLIPMTREAGFFMATTFQNSANADVIEIVSVAMMYQDADKNNIILAITYLKLAPPYEEKHSAFINVYFLSGEESSHVHLVDAVGMSHVQSLELHYFPFKLMEQQVEMEDGLTEMCFLLSGNDNKVHVFRLAKGVQTFYEDQSMAEKYFPEFSQVEECITQMEFKRLDANHRLSALGGQSGMVKLNLVNTSTHTIERHWEVDMDSPITSLQLFSHQVAAPRPDFLTKQTDETQAENTSNGSQGEGSINLLITSAIDPAVVFCDILESDLSRRYILPLSNSQDVVLCSCVMDIDFDGENEVLIGTYGQVLLAYKFTMERTPGMMLTSTPFQSPKPVPVLNNRPELPPAQSTSYVANAAHEEKSSEEKATERPDRRRHKSMASTHESSHSPNKHEKHDRHKSDDLLMLDGSLRDGQMARLVRSQENLACASPRSVYFQTPETSDSYEFLPQASLSDLSDGPSYRLKWTKRFSDPVMGLTCEDMMGDGMLNLVVLTLKGLHILQPDLNEVAELLLERLRPLCKSSEPSKEHTGDKDTGVLVDGEVMGK